MTHPPTNTTAPHSCGDICSRKRHTCSHSCPLPCHPGPCPPCQVALVVPCPSHNYPLTVKCHMSSNQSTSMTPVCGIDCGKPLACGNREHQCDSPCHYGPCRPCEVIETVRCYCGHHTKEVPCGWNRDQELLSATPSSEEDGEIEEWKGRYNCGDPCDRFFDCGIHPCKEVSPSHIFQTQLLLIFRHVTHTRSNRLHVPTRHLKSLLVHVEPPPYKTFPIILEQTVSHPSRHVLNDVRNRDLAATHVRGHVMKVNVHRVMKKWCDLVDAERVRWSLGVMSSGRGKSKVWAN